MPKARQSETQKAWNALYKPLTAYITAFTAEFGHPPFAMSGAGSVDAVAGESEVAPTPVAAVPQVPASPVVPLQPVPPMPAAPQAPVMPAVPPPPAAAVPPPAPPPPPPPMPVNQGEITDATLTEAFSRYSQKYGVPAGKALLDHFQIDVLSQCPPAHRQMLLDAANQ